MSRYLAVLLVLLGIGLGHLGHRQVDPHRVRTLDEELLVVPSGSSLRVASSGFHVQVADIMWMRTVLEFGSRFQGDSGWTEWLGRSLEAVTELDPNWRTPFFYGGSMLRVAGAYEGSTELFMRGSEAFPDDAYFPFSVGMNYYFDGDLDEAADWLAKASERPNAPAWYGEAAVAMRVRDRPSEQALHYLNEELANTTDPGLREALLERRSQTQHDVYVEGFVSVSELFEERFGRPPAPQELVSSGLMTELPPDPLGGEWIRDLDGVLRSSVRAAKMEKQDLQSAREMVRSWAEVHLTAAAPE